MKKKDFGFLSRIIECGKPLETTFNGPKVILTITVEVKFFFCNTWDVVEDRNFREKGNLSSEGIFLAFSFSIMECDKP